MLVKDAVELILKAKEDQKLLMIIAKWYLWHERNTIREEGRRRGANFLARCVSVRMQKRTLLSFVCRREQQADGQQYEPKKGALGKPPTGLLKA